MTRYAQELFAALVTLRGTDSVSLEEPVQRRYATRILNRHQTRRIDSAWCRYVAYPHSLKGRKAGVFHVLDHGYAQLVRCLDPERAVVTCHDLMPLMAAERVIALDVPSTVVRTFRWRMDQMARARTVIAVSRTTKLMLERYTAVRPECITIVPQGVNPTFRVIATRKSALRASLGLPEAPRVILQIASAGRYKNTKVLLEAFAQLRSSLGGDAILVRIGVPFYPDEQDLASRLGILEAIRRVGMIDDDGILAAWYNAADLLMFPSSWEGFGWPPLEAMACGTPVVASNIPAIAEVVGDAGILVPPQDPCELARAAERVLTQPDLADSLRQKGLERAGQFTWTNTARQTIGVYDEVLRESCAHVQVA